MDGMRNHCEDLQGLSENDIKDSFFRELSFGTGGLRGKLGISVPTGLMSIPSVRPRKVLPIT